MDFAQKSVNYNNKIFENSKMILATLSCKILHKYTD